MKFFPPFTKEDVSPMDRIVVGKITADKIYTYCEPGSLEWYRACLADPTL